MSQNLFLIIAVVNALTLLGVVFLILTPRTSSRKEKDIDLEGFYLKIRDDIRFSLQPMSDIPLGVEEIVELATEVWKIEQRVLKAGDTIAEAHKRGLESSIVRLKKYLQKFDVEIQDYSGQKYNEGFNFDILSREQDPSLEFPIIKETVEPTIICRGRVVKKAKVILASNQI